MKVERVYKSKDGFVAVSKESPFYPDGKGGQLGDRGTIGGRKVLKVFEKDGEIHHVLDGEIEVGEHGYTIDEKRRIEIARQHTAQHILSASFVKVADIDTVSFHMGEKYSTIDLNVPSILDDVLKEVEILANEIILSDREVLIHEVDREEAGKFPLRKPISDKVKGKVRIVEVRDFDWSACGGFHVERTGMIGIVKILNIEKVKGNLTRVYFVAGMRALMDYSNRVKILKDLSKILTASPEEMVSRIENMNDEIRKLRKKIQTISQMASGYISKELMKRSVDVGEFKIIPYEGPEEVFKEILKDLIDKKGIVIVAKLEGGFEIASNHLNVGSLIKTLRDRIGGRGGGGKNRGRLIVEETLDEIVEEITIILREGIE